MILGQPYSTFFTRGAANIFPTLGGPQYTNLGRPQYTNLGGPQYTNVITFFLSN